MIITKLEFILRVIESLQEEHLPFLTDDHGRIIIHTNLFEWCDGSFHDEEEIMEVQDGEYQLLEN